MHRNCLILTQYRNGDEYNDFIGKFYHFPVNNKENYLSQFEDLPLEFVYYEPERHGDGVFYGYGKISKRPFIDKKEKLFYYVEIDEYKPFSKPVYFKDSNGEILEKKFNVESYNANKAVRKISPTFLDDLCLDGGINLYFESDSHLIKVLGEQLIGSEKVGILELIKNSIDAGASYCRVRLENIPNLPNINTDEFNYPDLAGPVIIVEDDGCGMSKETIEKGWLRPASPIKTLVKEEIKKERQSVLEAGGLAALDALRKTLKKTYDRLPLGEKGVGRFATHRLGRYLELRTKTKNNPYELVLIIDWDNFDNMKENFINLNSIGLSLYRSKPSRNYGQKDSGTTIIVYGGRQGFKWDKQTIIELNRSILNLKSPILKKTGKAIKHSTFNPIFECPQIKNELSHEVVYEVSKPNFELNILVNNKGIAERYELEFKHPNDILPPDKIEGENIDLRYPEETNYWYLSNKAKRVPQCGEFYLTLKSWYRRPEWIDIENYKELIDYLDDYGGISVYRDGILVIDSKLCSEYDWLGLNADHIRKGAKISYRDFIGIIETNQIDNFELVDKSNREGLVENIAAKDFRMLIRNIITKILYPVYKDKRDRLSALTKGLITDKKTLSNITKTAATFFDNVEKSDYPLESDPFSFFAELWKKAEERRQGVINLSRSMKELQESIKIMQDIQDLFVEQAGFGIAVAISLHEINKITSNFYHGIVSLIKSGEYNKLKLEDLKVTSDSLQSELRRLSPLRSIRNEKSIVFNVSTALNYAFEVFRRRLKTDDIIFHVVNLDEDFQLYGRYSTITQIFGNLFDNSIYWIKYSNRENSKIIVSFDKKYRTVIFADSGAGINDIIRPNLFQPGYSLKDPPSGLGLFICKSYMENIKGRIYETPLKDRLPSLQGAQFTLDFSKSPVEEK
jgi:signal transduction histidine kinase